jgi:hypothetical protein
MFAGHVGAALVAESAVVVAGMVLFLRGCGLARGRRLAFAALTLALLAFTVAGMTIAAPPPSATAMAASSLATLVVCALMGWLGRPPPAPVRPDAAPGRRATWRRAGIRSILRLARPRVRAAGGMLSG